MSKKSFTFHWGHGIVLTFISFAAFMAYFYVQMSRQKIDLVGDHYYEDGQKFQEKLHTIAQTKLLKTKVEITHDKLEKVLLLHVPGTTKNLKVDLFFPGDASKDKHFTYLSPDSLLVIPIKNISKGKWKVTLTYEQLQKPYMEELPIRVD